MKNIECDLENLNWDKVNGLIPAIVQDNQTLEVLMLGYMNKEALIQTCNTKKITFYSRTKQRLWTKGETSGNVLTLVKITPDCDNDTLLIAAKPFGTCCHLDQPTCFAPTMPSSVTILSKLTSLIEYRYQNRTIDSYTAKLFDAGIKRIAQKVGEEGVEVALASVAGNRNEIINESADLLFHLLVLLKQSKIDFMEILSELANRAQINGHATK